MSFDIYLDKILDVTNSEFGFIGEILHDDNKNAYLKIHAITNIAWDEATKKIYSENIDDGIEFLNLNTLFGACILTGEPVVENDPANDPRSSGLPDGYPLLNCFLVLPVYFNKVMLGMVVIANRPDGYNSKMYTDLAPLLQTCGKMMHAYQTLQQEINMEAALKKSEQCMRALIDAAPDGLLMIDSQGMIRLINSQVEAMLGYSRQELLGHNIELLVPDEVKRHHPRLRDEYMVNPVTRTMQMTEERREVFARHKSGYSIPMEIGLSPMRMDDEVHVIASLRDITERKRLDSQLMQSQKMESVGKLTGGIAHDFNNFLGVIIGNLDLLSHLLKDDEKAKSRVEKATQAALRGAELTKRLLAFSRHQALAPKNVNVNETIKEMSEIITRTIGSNIVILKQFDTDIWMCHVDPHQLENVILNMSINARDAMPDGGKLIITTCNKVMTATSQEVAGGEISPGKYIVVEITDTGSGIAKEEQDRIFEPFYTTKEEGKGTGLGLAMVYGFVKQSSGYIKLYSELGHGSSFRIFLPKIELSQGIDTVVADDLTVNNLKGKKKYSWLMMKSCYWM